MKLVKVKEGDDTENTSLVPTDDKLQPIEEVNTLLEGMGVLEDIEDVMNFNNSGENMIKAAISLIKIMKGNRKLRSPDGLIALGSKVNNAMPDYGSVMLQDGSNQIKPEVWKMITAFFESLQSGSSEIPPHADEILKLTERRSYLKPELVNPGNKYLDMDPYDTGF